MEGVILGSRRYRKGWKQRNWETAHDLRTSVVVICSLWKLELLPRWVVLLNLARDPIPGLMAEHLLQT